MAFVAISNHVLDAAKTNRAVSLYRPVTSQEDLKRLATACMPNMSENQLSQVDNLIRACQTMMTKKYYNRYFYGLRDAIHFFTYLARELYIIPVNVTEAVERNFNGTKYNNEILSFFLKEVITKDEWPLIDSFFNRLIQELAKLSSVA